MKKSRLVIGGLLVVAIGLYSVVMNTSQVQATRIANHYLTDLSDAKMYVKLYNSGFQTYVNGSTILYHPNANPAIWQTTILPATVLTSNNDGSSDEKNACVDILNRSFRFETEIWANRGNGCGTNGSTSGSYSGGKVHVNPPAGVPVFLFIEDVDGLKDRQHIVFTSAAVQQIYTPNSDPAYDVEGGNNLVSNGDHVTCTGEANCNAIVLLRADLSGGSFNIKAGSKDGGSRMIVTHNTPDDYRTLTLNPNGGSVTDNSGDGVMIRSYQPGVSVLRDYIKENTASGFPTPARSGYTFQGWWTVTGLLASTQIMSSNVTLYAHWTPIPTWNIGGSVKAYDAATGGNEITTALPGQTVYFDYRLWNSGPSTSTAITYKTNGATGNGSPRALTSGQNIAARSTREAVTIPASNLNGTTYTRTLTWSPDTQDGGSGSAQATVTVTYSYDLIPSVTRSGTGTARVGDQVTFTTGVNKNTAYYSNPTDWAIRKIIIPAGVALPPSTRTGANTTQFSCAYYSGMTCTDIGSGTNVTFTINGTTPVGAGTYDEPMTLPIGYNICYAVMVDSASQAAKHNYRENVSCTLIAASPYVSVIGGNTWAGGSTTSPYAGIATIHGAPAVTFGSFGEYGVFATGGIDRFGSAALLGGTTTRVGGTKLTFASEDSLGLFATSHRITDLTARCTAADLAVNKTINATAVAPGTHTTICGNVVTIAGDITYTTTGVTSFKDLPSLTVIANTIQVNGRNGVNPITQIAGNFYATTKFVTCTEGPQTVGTSAAITTTGACSQPLVINGAVTVASQTTNSLVLNRSYGGTTTGEPAEVIRMRPEVFLTPLENSFNSASLTTVVETELPARY